MVYTKELCLFPCLCFAKGNGGGWGGGVEIVVMVVAERGFIHQCVLYIPKHDDIRMITEYFNQDFIISFPHN